MKKVTAAVTFLLLLTVLVSSTRADEEAVRCSIHAPAGLSAEALTDETTTLCHGFTLKKNARTLTKVERQFLGSGSILVSNDGERAVFIQSWFYGSLRGDGNLVASGLHYDQVPLTNDGLVFFHKGRKVASYTMEELIHRPNLVHVSTSHVHWLGQNNDLFRKPLGPVLRIQTSSFRELRFNTETGQMISSKDTADWHNCDFIAFGEVHFDGHPAMDPVYPAKGILPDRVTFKIPVGIRINTGYQTLCFKKGRTGWSVNQKLPALNGLSIAPNAKDERRFSCNQDADCTLHCDVGAVNRQWYEENRRSLGACQETCTTEGRHARCERRSCVTREGNGHLNRTCSRRR